MTVIEGLYTQSYRRHHHVEATMRLMTVPAAIVAFGLPLALLVERPVEARQTAQELEREVHESLRGEGDLRRIEVSVQGSEATLSGRVPTFWAKHQAIKRALDVDGIETVVSELEIPAVEDDSDLAEDVAKAVQRYPYYTLWDLVTGRVDGGRVSLGGRVTPERAKADEIFERVAKVRGVQDVQSDIMTLPPSQSDRNLRRAIARRVFSSIHFERFATMPNPPFHIIVHNSIITLVGYVQGQIELIELQRIVAQTDGVLRVENQLEKIR